MCHILQIRQAIKTTNWSTLYGGFLNLYVSHAYNRTRYINHDGKIVGAVCSNLHIQQLASPYEWDSGPCEQDTDIVFSTYVFRLKKLNKRNFSDIGLVISKQKSC